MAIPTHDDIQFKIRIPASLKSRIDAAAKTNSRSATAEILTALEERYPDQPQLSRVESALLLLKLALYMDNPDRDRILDALSDLEEDVEGLKAHIQRGLKQD